MNTDCEWDGEGHCRNNRCHVHGDHKVLDLEEKEAVTRNTAFRRKALEDLAEEWSLKSKDWRLNGHISNTYGICAEAIEALLSEADGQPEGATGVSSLKELDDSESNNEGSAPIRLQAEEPPNRPSPLLDSGEQRQ